MGFRRSIHQALSEAEVDWRIQRRRILKKKDPEALHRLRLLVKRLRAWWGWLLPVRSARPTWRRARQAYREAGLIRDHIILNRAADLSVEKPTDTPGSSPDWGALRKSLRPLRPGRMRRFFGALRRSLEREHHPGRSLQRELSTRMERVHTLRALLPDEETLHRIRRELKEMFYLMQLWVSAKPGDQSAITFHQWLNARQDQLGTWHDEVLRFHALAAHGAPAPEQEAALRHAKDLEKRAILALEDLDRAGGGMVRTGEYTWHMKDNLRQ